MAQTVRDVMTADPVCMPPNASITDAARTMRDRGIGDVLVLDGKELRGVVTDRDIVIRTIAEGGNPQSLDLASVCSSGQLSTVTPETTVDDAARLMRERAVRRLPVVEGGRPVGVVAIGDLAVEQDPGSALAEISAAPANR